MAGELDKALATTVDTVVRKQAGFGARVKAQGGASSGPWGIDLRTGKPATSPPPGANVPDPYPMRSSAPDSVSDLKLRNVGMKGSPLKFPGE